MNYDNFQDIPKITQAHYSIHVPWLHLERSIEQLRKGRKMILNENLR